MKKDKNMKNKEPKLNEVEIRYQDDRVILGKYIEQDLTWVFVPHDGDWKGCATLEFDTMQMAGGTIRSLFQAALKMLHCFGNRT